MNSLKDMSGSTVVSKINNPCVTKNIEDIQKLALVFKFSVELFKQ